MRTVTLARSLAQLVSEQHSQLTGAAGYSAVMTVWQYAQLEVRYDSRSAESQWTITWHGSDASRQDTAGAYDAVVAELNRAGTEGWELTDVATLDVGDNRHFLTSGTGDWSITRYTFRRPYDAAVATSTEPIPQPLPPAEPAPPRVRRLPPTRTARPRAQPPLPPTEPALPGVQPVTPAAPAGPGVQPLTPAAPAGPGVQPLTPAAPAGPGVQPLTPAAPAGPGVQPLTPAAPAGPGVQPLTPAAPAGPGVQPLTPAAPARRQGADPAASAAAGSVTLVRLTAYWLGDSEPPGAAIEGRGQGLAVGRVLIRRGVARPRSQADVDAIESLRAECQAPGVSKERREQIAAAAADYAASRVEGQFGGTWWRTSQSFPLSQAADLLDGSAEWLRGLVDRPLDDAASAAGAAGPFVPIGAGITANFVTAPLTRPLEGAARVCEIAGIVIGLAAGVPPLVLACAKRLAYDEIGQVLSGGFEQAITSIGAARDRTAGAAPDAKVQAPEPPRPTWTPGL